MAREMKYSGTQWLKDIPSKWKVGKIQGLYFLRNTKVSDKDYEPLSVTKDGILPQLDSAAKTNAHDDRKLVKKGDFAINSRSDRRGSCGISDRDGSVSLINTILAPTVNMDPGYYNWLFHTTEFADEFYKWGHGIVDDLWTTNWQDMKKILIPSPSLQEQQLIASFLDSKCSNIDSLVADITKEIELLKEYRKSVIYEAVTKGLDPNVEMKDSGIEWVGKIPTNWTTKPLKNLFSFGKGLSITKSDLLEEGYPVISYGQIHAKFNTGVSIDCRLFRYVDTSYLKTDSASLVNPNSFVFADTSEDAEGCGNCVYNDTSSSFFAGYHTIILKPKLNKNYKYLAYLFQTDIWRNQIRNRIVEVKLFTISQKLLKLSSVIIPSEIEQNRIVEHLDKKCSQIDSIISEKEQQIKKLTEYKKSLIYEYVTGKKEVPAV